MSDATANAIGVTPQGRPGYPLILFRGQAITTSSSHYWTSQSAGLAIITDIDIVSHAPSSGDWIVLSVPNAPNVTDFFGASVPSGVTGIFHSHWSGMLPFGYNLNLSVEANVAGGNGWSVLGCGYLVDVCATGAWAYT